MSKEFNWIKQQRKDVSRIFAPKIDYDKENDILYITWLPQFKVTYSLETTDGFVFDLAEINGNEEVKGIEIFDFMKKIKGRRK